MKVARSMRAVQRKPAPFLKTTIRIPSSADPPISAWKYHLKYPWPSSIIQGSLWKALLVTTMRFSARLPTCYNSKGKARKFPSLLQEK